MATQSPSPKSGALSAPWSFAAVLALVVIGLPSAARAGPKCPLPRSPFLLSTALPSALACKFDQDGNGLDDEVERAIAACVVPTIVFDSAEEDVAPGEPNVLFTSMPSSSQHIVMKFAYLFAEDGGPTLSSGFCALDSHAGDAQGLTVTVKVHHAVSGWYAEPQPIELEGVVAGWYGTHPAIFATAGKHHWKAQPGMYEYWEGCDDRANGQGLIVTPGNFGGSLSHVPALRDTTGNPLFPEASPLTPAFAGWSNACRFIQDGVFVAATGFQSNNLANLGYSGESILGPHFYSSSVNPVWMALAQNWNADPDGDGALSGYLRVGSTYFAPTDSCPWVAGPHTDDDGDGIGSGCDPEPFYRNVYVAKGSSSFPAYDPGNAPGPWISSGGSPVGPRGGYLDGDGDGRVRGEDACPASASYNTNRNRWGEVKNRLETPSLSSYQRDLGRIERADRCDPYPALAVELDAGTASPTHTSGGSCSIVSSASYGDTTVAIDLALSVGVSDNDPVLDQSNPSFSSKTYRVQVYRCACVGFSGEACLDNPASACHRSNVTASSPAPGRGWVPVFRSGCPTNRSGYCQPFQMNAVPTVTAATTIVWNWAEERALHPNHFAPGDFLTATTSPIPGQNQSHDHSKYSYALWAQVEEGEDFSGPPGPLPHGQGSHSGVWSDPETVDWGLLSVSSVRSRRLRAAFALPQALSEPYTVVDFGGHLCVDFPLIRILEKFWLPRPWWDHEGFSSSLPYSRLIMAGGPGFDEQWIGLPQEGTAYAMMMMGSGWVAGSSGKAALITGVSHSALQRGTASAEPQVLWVESGASARWALLTPTLLDRGTMTYALTMEGTLPAPLGAGELLADELGRTAAIADLGVGRAFLFDATLGDFVEVSDLSAVAGRSGAALALVDTELFVVGGAVAGVPQSDAWRVPLVGGLPRSMNLVVPARSGARLSLDPQGESLLLLGGFDARGDAHDDVHRLVFGLSGANSAVRLVSADTASRAQFETASTLLVGAGSQRTLIRTTAQGLSSIPRTVAP